MQFRSSNTVQEELGDITKCSDSTDEAVTLASFHVAGQFSVNLRLCSRRVFPVVYGTYVLILNVSKAGISAKCIIIVEIYYIACMEKIRMSISFQCDSSISNEGLDQVVTSVKTVP